MKCRIILDFETRSPAELKKTGAYKYSLDPSTVPTCLAAKVSGTSNLLFLIFEEINQPWLKLPQAFKYHWQQFIDSDYLFIAHNAFFEICIYKNILVKRYGWPDIPLRQWRCTAAKAAVCGLPRSLEGAGSALKLPIQKDMRGNRAMHATCKPTKKWKAWDKKGRPGTYKDKPPLFLEPQADPDTWRDLYNYCRTDILAEECLDDVLPELISEEQELWFLNIQLNWRGIRIDIPTVRKIVAIMSEDNIKGRKELDSLTMGLVTKPGAQKSILEFLAAEGVKLPNIRAKTVEDAVKKGGLSDTAREVLNLRKTLSKTSTKKYEAFLVRADDDDRIRDILMYHGAHTGRDTGKGAQFQNLPKGLIKSADPYAPVKNVVECDTETLKLLYGENLSILFSSVIRNMLIPSEGKEIFAADYSMIEVAQLWWLAGNTPGLKILKAGKSPYIAMAAENKGCDYNEIKKPSSDYDLGKAQVLGCGFGMGVDRFRTTAFDVHRLTLTEEQSRTAVQNYRKTYPTVPELWKAYERAAVSAIEGKSFNTGKCHFFVKDNFLWIRLPSGRKLAYREPQITWRETEWGPQKTIEFYGVNPKTKKWGLQRTWGGTLTENIVQACARDIMMRAFPKLEKAGYQILLGVHDEIIAERKIGEGDLNKFIEIMCERPPWGDADMPIEAKGWIGLRYRK